MQTLEQKILNIVEAFGMKSGVVAKAMNITEATYNSKKNPKNDRHKFNEKNLQDLINYIKAEAEKL